jgi:hypothetical protein
MKSIISSNRDLQKNKQQTSNKNLTTPPTTPIGTQFALTMLGMHKNASNSLQQHVSSTLDTLKQVQNSFSTPTIPSPNDKIQSQPPPPSPSPTQNRSNAQKSSTLDSKICQLIFFFVLEIFLIILGVSSSDTVEFGSKRTSFSPTLGSGRIFSKLFSIYFFYFLVHSTHGSLSSPVNSFDIFFSSPAPPIQTNSNDLNSFLSSPANNPKSSSPLFSNNDIYTTSSSPKPPSIQNPSRSSTRLRQLLTNKSPSTNDNPSQILHYLPETRLEDLIDGPESPTTTHLSPITNDLSSSSSSSSTKRRRKPSLTQNGQNNTTDILLKKFLEKQNSFVESPNKTESNHSDDSTSNGQITDKQRSDIFLRVKQKCLFLFFYNKRFFFLLDIT